MALAFGSSLASKVYLGATEINLAYFGATQVYSSAAFSAEAQNYFDRLDTAGDTTYVDYKQPLANYIDGLVALGGAYWDTMESAASFVGVGIQGITVPLRAGMQVLTNNNFVDTDLNQLTGLVGNGSTKYINANVTDSDTLQDDVSMSCWVSTATLVNNAVYMGTTRIGMQSTTAAFAPKIKSRSTSTNQVNVSPTVLENFFGQTRTNSANFDYLINGASGTATRTSLVAVTEDVGVFNLGSSVGVYSPARLATYHYGPALTLATIEALQATLLSEVVAAKAAAAAENYFSRLAAAGDTTHVAYKQPLTNYISSLVTLGGAYWDDMVSACSFVGVGIQGITVPLRAGMASATNVNNNFVAADLDVLTGLKGDGATKYIDTGALSNTLAFNNHSLSVYLTADRELGGNRYISGFNSKLTVLGNTSGFRARSASATLYALGSSTAVGELVGISRDNSADFDWSYETSGTQLNTSTDLGNVTSIKVFGDEAGNNKTAARLATYHIGLAINLATLEALQDTLITEIAAI